MHSDPAHLDSQTGSRPTRVWLRHAAIIFLASTVLGFFFSGEIYFLAASYHRDISWGQSLYWSFGDWYEWALMSPIIFWLCRTFRFDRASWPKSVSVHVLAGVVLSVAHAVMCALMAVLQGWFTGKAITFVTSLNGLLLNRTHYNLAVYALIVCAWYAWDYYRKFRARDAEARELAGRLAQAQLQALRMQLNPHFLFNTLNAVSSLMLRDVPAANRMISRLGELLRLTLEKSDHQEVSLGQEIEFLRRYLEIEQIRFGDRLQLKIDVDPSTLGAAVPNLILQPLVENAVRHAIEPQEMGGQIHLRSMRDNGRLLLQISDNGPGLVPQSPPENRERIGLSNTRERLLKLYGANQRFDLTENAMGGLTASLSIPFHFLQSPPAKK